MRQLRELTDEGTAQLLCDALRESGIESELMRNQRGSFGVWVIDEEKMPEAQELAAQWLDRGDRAALEQTARRGRASRELSQRIEERRLRQQQEVAERLAQLGRPKPAVLTWGLMAMCVGVAAITKLGDDRDVVATLLIIDVTRHVPVSSLELLGRSFTWLGLNWDQPWRLVTPIFLHFDPLHILFNMVALRVLGSTIEAAHGPAYLASFTVLAAALSNVAELQLSGNPVFGGMSGVVYGLLGMIWLRGRLDPRAVYGLSRGTVQFMLIWLVLGFVMQGSGVSMANWCHLMGLLVGAAWAYIATKLTR